MRSAYDVHHKPGKPLDKYGKLKVIHFIEVKHG